MLGKKIDEVTEMKEKIEKLEHLDSDRSKIMNDLKTLNFDMLAKNKKNIYGSDIVE